MQVCTACAVRADQVLHFDQRSVHFDTTSMTGYGEEALAEEPAEQAGPLTMTHGESKDKRPALKQCVVATLCLDRAVPIWGTPEDGHASDTTVKTPLLSTSTTFLAQHGVAPGASIDVADAALVTEDTLAALGDTLCSSR